MNLIYFKNTSVSVHLCCHTSCIHIDIKYQKWNHLYPAWVSQFLQSCVVIAMHAPSDPTSVNSASENTLSWYKSFRDFKSSKQVQHSCAYLNGYMKGALLALGSLCLTGEPSAFTVADVCEVWNAFITPVHQLVQLKCHLFSFFFQVLLNQLWVESVVDNPNHHNDLFK